MLMIPLPFLFAAAALFLLYRQGSDVSAGRRSVYWLAFLATMVFQETLIGVRFAYGYDWLGRIQPLSATLLSVLAYLSFLPPFSPSRPRNGDLIHLAPILICALIQAFFLDWLDIFLASVNLLYAVALIKRGLRGTDAFDWIEIGETRAVLQMLWAIIGLLIFNALTDAIIAFDWWQTQGQNTARIVTLASITAVLAVLAYVIWQRPRKKLGNTSQSPKHDPQAQAVWQQIDALMATDKLWLDPDLNLARIASKLTLPVRDVSRAINLQTGGNVSQYVNGLRVQYACQCLKQGERSVTEIAFASGFNTKSNFNREFTRVTGLSPSKWRLSQ